MRKLFLLSVLFSAPVFAQQPDLENGQAVWDKWCEPCHAVNPRKHPGTSALQVKYRGTETSAALTERTDLTPDLVTFYVRNGISIMPPSRKTEISDKDLGDLAAWLTTGKQ